MDLLKQGKVNKVPMVMGTALDDAAGFFTNHSLSTEDLDTLFDKYESRAASKPYLSEAHATLQNYSNAWWAAERAVTDQNFFCPTHFASRTLSNATQTFQYVLAHSTTTAPVVQHGDEIPLVFMNLPRTASPEEKQLAAEMATSWYRMALSGSPGGELPWPRQTPQLAPLLKFQVSSEGGSQVMDSNYRDALCAFMLQWLDKAIHVAEGSQETHEVVI